MIIYPPLFVFFSDTTSSSLVMIAVIVGAVLSFIVILTALGKILILHASYHDQRLPSINGNRLFAMPRCPFWQSSHQGQLFKRQHSHR